MAECPICNRPASEPIEPTAEWCINCGFTTAEAEASIVHHARLNYLRNFNEVLTYELEKGHNADHELVDYLRKEVKRLRRLMGDQFFDDWDRLEDQRIRTRYRVQQWRERQRKG